MRNQGKIYKAGGDSGELDMQLPRKMSAQNVMASISRTLGTRNDAYGKASNEVKLAGEESKDRLYEPKHRQKTFRVMIVIAYVICVSLAAIILSLYYAFIWDPKDHTRFTFIQSRINVTTKAECLNRTALASLTVNSESNEFHDGKITQIPLHNDTILLEKLKSVYPPLSDYENKKAITSEMKNEMFPNSSPTVFSPEAHMEDADSDTPDEAKINHYNFPKR